eukprot:36544-Eustigmatos_ZCMA.PRE.1
MPNSCGIAGHGHVPLSRMQAGFVRPSRNVVHYFTFVSCLLPSCCRLVDEISHLITSLSMLRGVSAEPLKLDEHFRRKFVQ